jgi:hypothetical protein
MRDGTIPRHRSPNLRSSVALRCSEPKQPPRLGQVHRPTFAPPVHAAEKILRLSDALRCSEPIQPPRLGKVYRPTLADVVHIAESILRLSVALRCSEPKHVFSPKHVFRPNMCFAHVWAKAGRGPGAGPMAGPEPMYGRRRALPRRRTTREEPREKDNDHEKEEYAPWQGIGVRLVRRSGKDLADALPPLQALGLAAGNRRGGFGSARVQIWEREAVELIQLAHALVASEPSAHGEPHLSQELRARYCPGFRRPP